MINMYLLMVKLFCGRGISELQEINNVEGNFKIVIRFDELLLLKNKEKIMIFEVWFIV